MADCQLKWEIINIRFGFVVFEKCSHCNTFRTYFSQTDHPIMGDEYLEGEHTWRCMENALSLPTGLKVVSLIAIGYPAPPLPTEKRKKSLGEILFFNAYKK